VHKNDISSPHLSLGIRVACMGAGNHWDEHHGYDGNHHRHYHRYDNGYHGHHDWHQHHRHYGNYRH
jgi:hypothetical protein